MKKICVVLLALTLFASLCASMVVSASADDNLLPEFSLGDTDLDGGVTIKDASEIQKYIAKLIEFTPQQKALADIDLNERVSISDATYIQKLIAGLVSLPKPSEPATEATTVPVTTKDYDKPIELPFVPAG